MLTFEIDEDEDLRHSVSLAMPGAIDRAVAMDTAATTGFVAETTATDLEVMHRDNVAIDSHSVVVEVTFLSGSVGFLLLLG